MQINIPASLDAPHLIYKDRQRALFGAPFRDGTSTNWMAERQLEGAYRLRFTARTDRLVPEPRRGSLRVRGRMGQCVRALIRLGT